MVNMATYTITEKQNVNSTRIGEVVEAKSLSDAKRIASRSQCFCGTVMTIEHEGHMFAYKKNGSWFNA